MFSSSVHGRAAAAAALVLATGGAQATTFPSTVSPVALGSAGYTQDFNTLASTGTTGTALPAGWQVSETGTRAANSYSVDDGSSNSGAVYSYGTTGSSDRALGSLGSGSLSPAYYGGFFTNALGGTLTALTIAYTGEQWRGASANDQLTFQYSLDATDVGSGDWTTVSALNFASPNPATTGALDGNAAGNRTAITGTISGLSIG